ncbi:MAG: type II toxin-antitoxin system RelE/ParE family toxin [Candidatus Nanopelagicales bacterium]|nr:type II toxin-antitoxin system RelE/ParE family toxin [Candidatus Nanopelagicales bacterium]
MADKYTVSLAPAAIRDLKKLDRAGRHRVQTAIDLLATEPRPPGARKLSGGTNEWRVRTGDYRIIYEVDDRIVTVLVLALGHRRDIYRR